MVEGMGKLKEVNDRVEMMGRGEGDIPAMERSMDNGSL